MKKVNEGFVCISCKKEVIPAQKTSRNHCPFCFMSQHVDDKEPGDRLASCESPMIPLEYRIANGKTRIHFICTVCPHDHRNKACEDDDIGYLDQAIKHWKQKYKTLERVVLLEENVLPPRPR